MQDLLCLLKVCLEYRTGDITSVNSHLNKYVLLVVGCKVKVVAQLQDSKCRPIILHKEQIIEHVFDGKSKYSL